MSDNIMSDNPVITVFGGAGFVGRHVVRALARKGWRIRVACRRPDLANHLQPLGRVGQIHAVQANMRYPASIAAALRGADAAINLVSILRPTGRQTFEAVNSFGARAFARLAREAGVHRIVHVSALGADIHSDSDYARTKGEAEQAILDEHKNAVILRPSVIFGPEDEFINRFAALARLMPIMPLFGGGDTRFQPIYVGDVAQAVVRSLDADILAGSIYELGGPEIKTMHEIVEFVCDQIGRKRLLVPVPSHIGHYVALGLEIADSLTFGLMPDMIMTTRDQVKLLGRDNIVSQQANESGHNLRSLGVEPESMDSIIPPYLVRFRKTGQYERQRLA
jgi:uncharacterized protein YbjT (DUF2867 family)